MEQPGKVMQQSNEKARPQIQVALTAMPIVCSRLEHLRAGKIRANEIIILSEAAQAFLTI